MKVKTSELIGSALDWAVAKCEGEPYSATITTNIIGVESPATNYSSDWAQGGPIIDEALVSTGPIFVAGEFHCWEAFGHDLKYDDNGEYIEGSDHRMYGPTRLIAGLRCFVASKLGDEVEVPEELL